MRKNGYKKFRVSMDANASPGPGTYNHLEMNRSSLQVMQNK